MATTVWVTKYLFTKGIQKEEGCEIKEKYATRGRYGDDDYLFMSLGRQAFLSEAEATAQAVKMCRNKLKGLTRDVSKIEAMLKAFGG